MLSGIGPKDHLTEMGIPVLADLDVGKNLQDHVGLGGLAFLINKEVGIRYDNITTQICLWYKLTQPIVCTAFSKNTAGCP